MGSYTSAPEPEILSPGQKAMPRPVRRPKPSWAAAPATYALVGINCAVFLAMVAHGISFWLPTVPQLVNWGADNAGLVLIGGQWWRIVTAMFVHVGFWHILLNMWCLWNLGLLAEPLMGSTGVIAVFVLTGAAGDLLSTFGNWWMCNANWVRYHDVGVFPVGAGASGAIFGIAGALILLLNPRQLPMVPQQELKKLRRSVIYFAAINLVLGMGIFVGAEANHWGLNVDIWAHLGGLGCGLLFAAPMVPRLGTSKARFVGRLRVAIGATVGLLVLFGFFLAQLPRGS
ncbi:MAG: rhomboid family intramembrane serine protease [Terracidiphilus sp.]